MNTTANKKNNSSQDFVPIKEVREGIIVLEDGTLRMVVMASSLNFALKSTDEQEAIILQYQNFLNSLDFFVQFFIQSRNLNIEPYLETLKKKEKEKSDELLKIQIREYIEFVREFVTSTKIVSKSFYVVIPYSPPFLDTRTNPIIGFINKFFKKNKESQITPGQQFEEYRIQLQQRTDTVTQGLSSAGIRTVPLNTEELIELFYHLYNPGEGEGTKTPQIQ